MKSFNMPIMEAVYKPFDLNLLVENYKGDASDLELTDILKTSFNDRGIVIKFQYDGIQGEVQISRNDIWWVKQQEIKDAFPQEKFENIERIMYIIAEVIFQANDMFDSE